MQLLAKILLVPVLGYRYLISPVLPPSCRFLPTCSDYAQQAIRTHGARRGVWLAIKRISRCHRFGGSGYDPVPDCCCQEVDH